MVEVTLNKARGASYLTTVAGHKMRFLGGEPVHIENELAPLLEQEVDRHGKKLFTIRYENKTDPEIENILGVQLEFSGWPS